MHNSNKILKTKSLGAARLCGAFLNIIKQLAREW
ncbi:hypothetical protein WIS42_P01 [Staphylococcus phage vB_SpsM_WIS42]|uniref:Uncharacterized protein n=1 Tax=Staphylococcus phage vB_SpsM_WIS42 TaxID=2596715 RepID=A0A5B8RPG2_9CAUD|nr:hypothetical protein KMD14_gp01 [Staphylococcus phage vB_SpsM_WIS42]QEA09978.1 hypothetical protein WIS42_P01 [Staphylococcus phage vB_SpsM_WIS42]